MSDSTRPFVCTNGSNIPWLESIPAHWGIAASKRLFAESKERAWPTDAQLSATQSHGVILQEEYERIIGRKVVRILQHLDKRRHVEKDDFVISMRSFQGGLERSWSQGAIRSSYVVLKPGPKVWVPYFAHLFKSHPYIQALRATSNFIRDGQDLNFSNFCMVDLPVVPMEEQKRIANYLDANAIVVRKFIRNRRRLIAVLNEQKQAIINRAVTRGLDPNVKLKPSGIDWLGEMPAHWRGGRIKTEMDNLNTRRVPLSGTDRGRMTQRLYDYYGASSAIDKVDDYLFDDDLLLIAEDGANLVLRNLPLAIIARGKFWVNNHAHILKPRHGSLEYFAALLEQIDYSRWITGAAQPKLTQDRLMAVRIPVPPDSEQAEIAAWIEGRTREFNSGITTAEREIDLIREYRTRLIADVVTGKLDVRHLAPPPGSLDEEELAGIETDDRLDDESVEEDADLDEESSDADD